MENNIENSTQETTDDNIKYNNIIFYTKLFESNKSIIYIDPSDEYILKKYTPNKITQKHVENEIYILQKLSKHNKDWRGFYNFNSICAVFPKSANEISKILNSVS